MRVHSPPRSWRTSAKSVSSVWSILNPKGARAHAQDMLIGQKPVDFSLWRMINLGIWGRLFAVTA
jgi:asparagine synthase (glutamine-hydrolysing)